MPDFEGDEHLGGTNVMTYEIPPFITSLSSEVEMRALASLNEEEVLVSVLSFARH